MKCAIQLVFNEKNQVTINKIRKYLANNGVHDEAVPINHISLADIEIEENQLSLMRDILNNFAQTHKSLNFSLVFAGSFMTSENVLFFSPIMTEDLINYNDEIVKILSSNNIACGKYYTKNNWQPHCTIAIRLSDEEICKGFELLKKNNILPLNVTADKIDLLCYDPKPYNELMSFNLK